MDENRTGTGLTESPGATGSPFDLVLQTRAAFRDGKNVTEFMRGKLGLDQNTADIIETAYDLQAGSYIASAREASPQFLAYVAEMAALIAPHVLPGDCVLDAGTGEMTSLSHLVARLPTPPARLCAFDISWSRLFLGTGYACEVMPAKLYTGLQAFVADLGAIPLADGSVDVTITAHALEPNGEALPGLLAELLRVTRRKLVLFEPSYETASPEAQARMNRLGYIRNLAATATALGAHVDAVVPLTHSMNAMNPTAAFVLSPPPRALAAGTDYTLPGTSLPLVPIEGMLFSEATGWCFPVLRGLPILRRSAGFLASALAHQ